MVDTVKKVMKWILSVMTFTICALLLFARVSEILREKTGRGANMMKCLYETAGKGNADVICLGSSHGYWAVQSNYLWDEYGMSSLVMCSPRQTVASSYYVLKEVLKYHRPKVVLLEAYYFYFGEKFVDEDPQVQIRKAFDGLHSDEVKREMLDDFLEGISWKDKLTYYIPFLQYHSRWESLKNYDFHSQYYLRGSALGFSVYPTEDPGIPETASEISETNIEYLERLDQLCRENGIHLVVFASPMGKYENDPDNEKYARIQGYNVALESLLACREIPFLFYQKMRDVYFDFSADFLDSAHLNTLGGIKLSKHLGEWLQQHYQIPDHRGEEMYQAYEDDYQRYRDAFESRQDAAE